MNDKISRGERLLMMLLDHVFMTLIMFVIGFIPMVFHMIRASSTYSVEIPLFTLVPFMFCFGLYLNKDFFGGRSIAKRLLGYKIISKRTKEPANEIQLLVRNLLLPLWPIEVLVSLITPKRKIGDYLAGTEIIKAEKLSIKTLWLDLKAYKLNNRAWIAIVLTVMYLTAFSTLSPY